nr:MAG TPA: hypothetical protein [Bacteriophage sp.]
MPGTTRRSFAIMIHHASGPLAKKGMCNNILSWHQQIFKHIFSSSADNPRDRPADSPHKTGSRDAIRHP